MEIHIRNKMHTINYSHIDRIVFFYSFSIILADGQRISIGMPLRFLSLLRFYNALSKKLPESKVI